MLLRAVAAVAENAITHRGRWLAGLGLAAGLALLGVARLELSLDADDLVPPPGAPGDSQTRALVAAAAGDAYLALALVDTAVIPVPDAAAVLEGAAARLSTLGGVSAVRYRTDPALLEAAARHLQANGLLYLDTAALRQAAARLSGDSILAALSSVPSDSDATVQAARRRADPLGLAALVDPIRGRLAGGQGLQGVDGYLALPNRRAFLAIVELDGGRGDLADDADLVRAVESELDGLTRDSAIAPLLAGRRLIVSGRQATLARGYALLREDLGTIGMAATVGVVLLLALWFREARAPLLLMVPVVVGLLLTVGAAGIALGRVSMAAWIFVPVLIGLGIDFGIHILCHYWGAEDAHRPASVAVLAAVRRPGRAISLGAVTSAAAFLALTLVSVPVMRDIGLVTAGGLLAMWLLSVTVLPILLTVARPTHRPSPVRFLGRLPVSRSGSALTGALPWVVLLVAGGWAALRVDTRLESRETLRAVDPTFAELETLQAGLGAEWAPRLLVARGRTAHEALTRERHAVERLRHAGRERGIAAIAAPSDWLPDPSAQAASLAYLRSHPEAFSADRVRRDFRDGARRLPPGRTGPLDDYLDLVTGSLRIPTGPITLEALRQAGLGGAIDRRLVDVPGGYASISAVTLRAGRRWADPDRRFAATVRQAGVDTLAGVSVPSASTDERVARIRRDAVVATLVALLAIVVLLGTRFRSPTALAVCVLPLVCGLAAVAVVMALLDIPLGVMTLAVAPIVVGLGVDDGIHIVDRLHDGQPLEVVLREAGAGMSLTTLTTLVGFASLGLARFPGLADVGLVGSVGLAVCLLASLHLVPRFARFLGDRGLVITPPETDPCLVASFNASSFRSSPFSSSS